MAHLQHVPRYLCSLLSKLRLRISLFTLFVITSLAAIAFSCHERITIHREHITASQLLAEEELEFDYGVFPATQQHVSLGQYINPPDTFADLHEIRIRSGHFNKHNARQILSFRNLHSIQAWSICSITPLLRELAGDRRIKSLSIGSDTATLTRADMSSIGECQSLEEIELYDLSAAPTSFQLLRGLPNLKRLTLAGDIANNQVMEAVSQITSLESVEIDSTIITDHGVQQLAKLPNLKRLAIYNSPITGIGFSDAGFRSSLKELKLHYCAINDRGLTDIQNIRGLKALRITHESLSAEAIDSLHANRRDLVIDINLTIDDDFPL